ncbi:hypothetical protein Plec18170_009308 [Paecilomyces lecythidis]
MAGFRFYDSEMAFPAAYDDSQIFFYPEQSYTFMTASPPIDPSIRNSQTLPESSSSYTLVPPELYADNSMTTAYPSPTSFQSCPMDIPQMNSQPSSSMSTVGSPFDAESSQYTSGSSTTGSPTPGNHNHTHNNSYNHNSNLTKYGFQNSDGTWRCAYPGCTSRAVFTRGCDLRKHFNRHSKHLFCRYEGCPQATEGGFSSNKDRTRHEAKHNPGILCEWDGCSRVFSRVDNMKDHVRRIHKKRRT